jgi:aldose 1-epimerase
MIAPSGKQITIVANDQQAVVVEVGGGLRSYSIGGRELLDGYGADEMSSSGRGQVLIPWPNRLQDGSYEFNGASYQLPLNEPERRNAIHGLVRWSAWSAAEREPHRVVMEHILYPQPGYPFFLGISIEYALSNNGLQVRTTATNLGTQSCPYGSGAHPYLTLGTATIDDLILHVPGRTVLRSGVRGLPIGREAVEGTEYDFRQPKRIGSIKLDHAFTDLERDADGLARVELRDSDRNTMVSPLGRPDLLLLDALQRRYASKRPSSQPCRRAHDLPAERISNRGRSDPPGARCFVHGHMGHRRRAFTIVRLIATIVNWPGRQIRTQ